MKGTEEIFRHEIPNAEVIGTAMTEQEFWPLMEAQLPDLVLLDLGLGGSTTIGVDICRNIFKRYKGVRVLIFTGEILNEKLWVDVLECRCRRHYPQNRRVADQDRRAGSDGRQEAGLQLSDTGEDSGTLQEVGT